jgi:pathogenesis-related protein 1
MSTVASLTIVAAASLLPAKAACHGQSAAVPANTGSRVSQAQAQLALDFHNVKRHDVGSPPLQWSPVLATVAQNWATHLASDNGCRLSHTVNGPYGENLFGGSGAPYTALDAAKDWYSEISKYPYGALTAMNFAPTGHYTQMVWSRTTQVGIGQASCPGGGTVIAAEYSPPGNYIGQKPY